MDGLAAVMAAVLLATSSPPGPPPATAVPAPVYVSPRVLAGTAPGEWSFSAAALVYIVPDDRDYVQPTFTADRGWLHLEARYNYEDLDTGSAWVGYNFGVGKTLTLEGTLMVGGVIGETTGIASGYKLSLGYRGFTAYTEGEYVFDLRDPSGNFFYSWSELTYSPTDWLRFGLVAQRTKAFETEFKVQPGLLLAVTYKRVELASYVFNVGLADPLLVFSLSVRF